MRNVVRVTAVLVAGLLIASPALASARPDVLFTRVDGLSGAGQVLAEWTARARFHGIDLTPDARVAAWVQNGGARYSLATQLEVEQALATALERLLGELPPAARSHAVVVDTETRFYRSPDSLWQQSAPRRPNAEALDRAREAALAGTLGDHLAGLLPAHPQYRLLVAAAERYAGLCAAGGWSPVVAPKIPKLRKRGWTPPPEVAQVFQARLMAEGLYPPAGEAPSGVWDAGTEAALADFRAARQVPVKGLDDPDLLAALAVSCEARLATLVLNVKRWRVSAWQGEPTFVEVNVAAQEMRYVRDGARVMEQRTIVGSTKWYFDTDLKRRLNLHATPILKDEISRIVVNPIWAVPARIARNEIDVEVAKDPTYLTRHNIQLVTSERGRTYIQAAGPGNSLGLIEILFPNDEDVYLHDTPKKGAFKLAVRALSHGCVRVQNAVDFGMALLAADAAAAGQPFDEASLRARVGHGGSLVFNLTRPVPVFLEYYTASVDEAGRVRFHPDIYAYDAEHLAAGR